MTQNGFAVGGERSAFAIGTLVAVAVDAALLLIASHVAAPLQWLLFVIGDVLQLVAIVAFGAWLHRAYANLAALHNPSRYAPSMAVAFFLLPLVSFFLPQAILEEIWRKSAVADPRSRTAVSSQAAAPWFELWWYVFLASSIVFNYVVTQSLEDRAATTSLIVCAALSVVSALLGTNLVRRIDQRQKAAYLVTSLAGFKPPAAEDQRSPMRDLLMPIFTMAEEERRAAVPDPPKPPPSPRREGPRRVASPKMRELGAGGIALVVFLYLTTLVAAINVVFWGVIILRPLPDNVDTRLLLTALLGPTSLVEWIVIGTAAAIYRARTGLFSMADDDARASFRVRIRLAQIAWACVLLIALSRFHRLALGTLVVANVVVIAAAMGTRRLVLSSARARTSVEGVSAPAIQPAGPQ